MNKRRGLGRGLEALIPSSDYTDETAVGMAQRQQALRIPIQDIRPNPDQPRQAFGPEALQELADSIRQHGILQPLLVRELPDDGYELIAGERRLRAAQIAGLTEVPVIIHNGSTDTADERLQLSLIENLQRSDLNPVEEARAIRRLLDEFGLTQEGVAARLGKGRVSVANAVRLLGLPDVALNAIEAGAISAAHGRAILGLHSIAQQHACLERVIQEHWSVRQTEDWVRSRQDTAPSHRAPRTRKGVDADTLALEQEFRQALGTKVILTRFRDGGRLTIEFYTDEELEGLRVRLVGS
jgi:ParB family transcriptional regulator, chromosome partitioning protein